jgi:hypothetical protein
MRLIVRPSSVDEPFAAEDRGNYTAQDGDETTAHDCLKQNKIDIHMYIHVRMNGYNLNLYGVEHFHCTAGMEI